MNKKLIAAAVAAGLVAPMAAHADVSVYGVGSLAITNQKVETATTSDSATTVNDPRGNTRFGIRWSEDLGGGMSALGEFEFAPNAMDQTYKSTGTVTGTTFTKKNPLKGGLYSRQTWMGLKGSFGQIEIGTVLQPYKYAGGVKYDAFTGTDAEARGGDGGMLKSAFGQGGYFANAIAYRNHMGNVSFAVAYSPSDEDDTANLYAGSKGDLMANLIFKLPGGEVGVAYAKNDTAGDVTAATTADGQANTKIFGKYSFGPSTILAQYESSTSNGSNQEGGALKTGSTTEYEDLKVLFVGYRFKMGMNTLVAQYGKTSFDGGASEDIKYMAVGAIHHFSKKTSAYVAYRQSKQDPNKQTVTTVGLIEKF